MSRTGQTRWRAWVAAIAGVLLALKAGVYVVPRLFRVVTHEAQNRGADVNLAVNLANRGRRPR